MKPLLSILAGVGAFALAAAPAHACDRYPVAAGYATPVTYGQPAIGQPATGQPAIGQPAMRYAPAPYVAPTSYGTVQGSPAYGTTYGTTTPSYGTTTYGTIAPRQGMTTTHGAYGTTGTYGTTTYGTPGTAYPARYPSNAYAYPAYTSRPAYSYPTYRTRGRGGFLGTGLFR